MLRRILFLTTGLLALALVSLGARANGQDKPISDRHFTQEAAMGGMAEVKVGELAAQKGTDPSVKSFGQRMVQDHSIANKELMDLLRRKGSGAAVVPKNLDAKHKEMYNALAQRSGRDFDKAYIKAMVNDHEEDAALFEAEAKNGQDADLKAFAAKTLPVIKEHLRMAREIATKLGVQMSRQKHL